MISAPFGVEFTCAQAMRPADFFVERRIELRLDIVLDLNGSGVRLISLQPQHKIVLPGCERKSYGRLTSLFRAVDEHIGSRGLAADVNAFGQRFEFDLLVLGVAALYLQRSFERVDSLPSALPGCTAKETDC